MLKLILEALIVASLALSVYMIVVTLERCRSEKRYGFVYCIVTLFLYNLGYLIEIGGGEIGRAIIGVKISYAGGNFMAVLFFFFVADYCEIKLPRKFYRIPMLIVPVLHYCVVLTFDKHQLLYLSYFYDTMKAIPDMEHTSGPLYLVGQLYPVFCVILSCIVLIRSIVKQSRGRRFSLVLLFISALAPMVAHVVYLVVLYFSGTAVLFTAFLTIFTNFIFYYNVVRNDMFDLAPKAHAITMDMIRDSFVVLDWSMAYTGSNRKAKELFPALVELQKGSSILDLENWPPELMDEPDKTAHGKDIREEVEFTLPHRPGKIYSGWTNRVVSEAGVTLGWIILIQDITETVSLIRNIQAQRDEIAAMRDNLKEGIFLMDKEFKIQDSYSRAMEELLSGKNLRGRRFTDMLSKSFNSRDLGTVADYFTMIMDKSVDPDMLEDMNPLSEFSYTSVETKEQKTLRCLFAPVDQGGGEVFVMGTIQDITAEVILKRQLADEEARRQDEMRSLFEIMQVDQKVFENFIEDSDHEFHRIKQVISDKRIPGKQKLVKIYQSVHAIKSNALIVGLKGYGEKLHALETKIKALQKNESEPRSEEIAQLSEELVKREKNMEEFTEIIKRIRDFSASGTAMKDDEVFVQALKQACELVAKDENKKVSLVIETFDKEALNRGPRREMKEILTQLVRNSVYHGIENTKERIASGKDEEGKITLSVIVEDGFVRMVLRDDGRGLDFAKITQTAKEKGLLKNLPPEKITKQFLTGLIFSPGFSTASTENIHAGRGIGLNLVRERLLEIKGKIDIQSREGRGLAFDVRIPA